MNHERLDLLFKKQRDGTISVQEKKELHHLMADPKNSDQIKKQLRKEWDNFQPKEKILTDTESDELLSSLLDKVSAPRKSSKFHVYLWRAAAILLIVCTATALYIFNTKDKDTDTSGLKMNQVSTRPGSKTRLQLADGTQVWLHSNSRLVYNTENFGKTNREVTLYGEAYFDVVKNAKLPFLIHTGQVNISVKGTAFNVKAYPGDKAVEATLIRGIIEVSTVQDPDRKILLKPNEKILIPINNIKEETNEVLPDTIRSLFSITRLKQSEEPPAEVSWIQEQLSFDDETLSSIAPKMASWYHIDIQFMDEEVKKRRFSGTIENETLKETLEAMRLSFPFEYKIADNVLYIGSK